MRGNEASDAVLVASDVGVREPPSPVDVAVGVLLDADGRFLLAQRPDGKPMPGYWEFPGGKLEPGESVFDALAREFDEELGLVVTGAHPWAQRVVVYPHATVRLHFWRSFAARGEWRGDATSREGQAFRWERIDALTTEPWLPGALPAKRWLRLAPVHAISDATAMGDNAFLARLDAALVAGTVRQLQLREPGMDDGRFDRLFAAVLDRCRAHGASLVVSSRHPSRYARACDGIHLTARDLMALAARPDVDWCFASCHSADELARAASLGADAAVVGAVRPTATHPDREAIGWRRFAELARTSAIPVYAIGGLDATDAGAALDAGAHGIAMVRGAWR